MRAKYFFEKHKIITFLLVNMTIFIIVFLFFEILLRFYTEYSIDYYTGTKKVGYYQYPYGNININSLGYPDNEFNFASRKPRIGYIGDSVNYGVGAGYPYRISDLVETEYPQFEHWNLSAGLGTGFSADTIIERAQVFGLNTMVYLFNLNDIGEIDIGTRGIDDISIQESIVGWLAKLTNPVRDKSYVANFLRTKIKYSLQKAGFGSRGRESIELYPEKNSSTFERTCRHLNKVYDTLQEQGIDFCVIMLPYEMQISEDAANTYKEMGFKWEPGFERGSAQEKLKKCVGIPNVFDAISAFDSLTTKVGEYYVFNKGDKIDWNHPNRAGHRVIAQEFIRSNRCPFLRSIAETD